MTDQGTSTVSNDNLLMAFFSRKALVALKNEVALYALAEKEPLPQGSGTTITFNGWRTLGGASAAISQYHASANSAVTLSSRKVTATLSAYGRWIKMSDLLIKTSILPVDVGAVEMLTQSAKVTLDDVIQLAAFSNKMAHMGARAKTKILSAWVSSHTSGFCSNTRADHAAGLGATGDTFGFPVLFGTSATRLSAINASSASLSARIGPVGLRKAVTRLQRLAVQPYAGGSYVAVMHPYAMQALMANPLYVAWVVNYAEGPRESVFPGEVRHSFYGCRFVVAQNMPYYRKAATASAPSCNLTLILGRGALAVSELEGDSVQIILKRPGANTTSDPYSILHTASFLVRAGAAVTNPSCGVILITNDPGSVTG